MLFISLADIRGGKTETHVNVASLYAFSRKMVTINSTASKIVTDEQRGTSKTDVVVIAVRSISGLC
ncbi:hypothetical protein [Microcystis aeruginosa]|uniref:hypothetical protein n=1 Tax=Microcystis aeruginosa TaxID=1126 RepID=UPI00232C92BA|nr:hypothetical protein [Microcystis aeruginosa]MDB9417281.1 hypothetical protein [Microcystis aeruginosa CS-556/03]